MITQLGVGPGDTILELAAGAGDTGFEAAAIVGERGRLISTDFSPEMVGVARRRGVELGLRNVEYRVIDAALGVVERGTWVVAEAVEEQPWLPNGPIATTVTWRHPDYVPPSRKTRPEGSERSGVPAADTRAQQPVSSLPDSSG